MGTCGPGAQRPDQEPPGIKHVDALLESEKENKTTALKSVNQLQPPQTLKKPDIFCRPFTSAHGKQLRILLFVRKTETRAFAFTCAVRLASQAWRWKPAVLNKKGEVQC